MYKRDLEAAKVYNKKYHQNHYEEHLKQGAIYRENNRALLAQKQRKYYALHRKERLLNTKTYFNTHKDLCHHLSKRYKSRKRHALHVDLSLQQWEEIQAAYHYRCVYCDKKPRKLEMDHITPLSKNGNHTATNIVPACRSCNAKKRDKKPLVPVQPILLTVAQPKPSLLVVAKEVAPFSTDTLQK